MTDLLPCPFCGGEADICLTNKYWEEPEYTVQCDSCFTTVDSYDTEAEAIAAWNTRSAGTCEYVGDDVSGGCSVCHGWLDPACSYCPSCGRKVVSA